MNFLFFVLLIAILITNSFQMVIKIRKFYGNCPDADKEKLTVEINNVNVTVRNNIPSLNFTVNCKENLPESTSIALEAERCTGIESRNTCEKYHIFKIPNICKIFKIKGPWAPFIRALQPAVSCPVKKGFYKVKNNVQISLDDIPDFMLTGSNSYVLIVKLINGKNEKMLSCTRAEFELVRTKTIRAG